MSSTDGGVAVREPVIPVPPVLSAEESMALRHVDHLLLALEGQFNAVQQGAHRFRWNAAHLLNARRHLNEAFDALRQGLEIKV